MSIVLRELLGRFCNRSSGVQLDRMFLSKAAIREQLFGSEKCPSVQEGVLLFCSWGVIKIVRASEVTVGSSSG